MFYTVLGLATITYLDTDSLYLIDHVPLYLKTKLSSPSQWTNIDRITTQNSYSHVTTLWEDILLHIKMILQELKLFYMNDTFNLSLLYCVIAIYVSYKVYNYMYTYIRASTIKMVFMKSFHVNSHTLPLKVVKNPWHTPSHFHFKSNNCNNSNIINQAFPTARKLINSNLNSDNHVHLPIVSKIPLRQRRDSLF